MTAESVFIRLLLIFLLAAFFGLNSNAWAGVKTKINFRTEPQQRKVAGNYRIRFDENNVLLANVEAEIAVKDGHLYMAAWGADYLPNGWASFIKNLRITNDAGKVVNYESKPNGAWQLSSISDSLVRLSYQVDLSFTKTKWIYGNEQAGVYQDGALYVVTKALFIVSDDSSDYQINFNLPANWKISAPWQTSGADGRSFVAEDKNDLINNSVVLGKHTEYIFKDGNFTFSLALLGGTKDAKDLIAPTLQKTLHSYIQIFDKTPPTKFLMTVFYSGEADAEAFGKSAAFTERDPLTKDNLIRWGNTVAHEFFHSWNGHAVKGEGVVY